MSSHLRVYLMKNSILNVGLKFPIYLFCAFTNWVLRAYKSIKFDHLLEIFLKTIFSILAFFGPYVNMFQNRFIIFKRVTLTWNTTKKRHQKNRGLNASVALEHVQTLEPCSTQSRVIVVTSGKGGVGKTSATANIGMSIARLGYKTLLMDADIGLKNLDLLVGLENRIMYTVMDVFEGHCRLDQAIIRDKRWKNLSLLSISKNRQRYHITRKNMENVVQALVNLNYDYILIDCPAGIDVGFINAISPANEALIVTTPELPALRDADRVAGLLEANGIYDIKLLVNRVRSDLIASSNMLSVKDVQEALGLSLLGAIPEDTQIILSTNYGEPLVLRNKLTLAGIAFETVARRLVGHPTDFLDLETPYKNIFQKLSQLITRPFS